MTGAGGIGKQKPPVKEKYISSLKVTLANYRGGGGFSLREITYSREKKLLNC